MSRTLNPEPVPGPVGPVRGANRGTREPEPGTRNLSSNLLLLDDLRDVCIVRRGAEQMLREVIDATPEDVVRHRAEPVADARQQHEVEALVRADQRVNHAIGPRRMHVVVDVAGDQQQLALEILGDVLVLLDVVFELDLVAFLDLADAVVLLAPPPVIDRCCRGCPIRRCRL